MNYLITFLQSNFLEVPIYCVLHSLIQRSQRKSSSPPETQRSTAELTAPLLKSTLLTTTCNAITHPLVFFLILSKSSGLTWGAGIVVAETFAIFSETLLHGYSMLSFERRLTRASLLRHLGMVFCASALANLMSWELGPLLTWYSFLQAD